MRWFWQSSCIIILMAAYLPVLHPTSPTLFSKTQIILSMALPWPASQPFCLTALLQWPPPWMDSVRARKEEQQSGRGMGPSKTHAKRTASCSTLKTSNLSWIFHKWSASPALLPEPIATVCQVQLSQQPMRASPVELSSPWCKLHPLLLRAPQQGTEPSPQIVQPKKCDHTTVRILWAQVAPGRRQEKAISWTESLPPFFHHQTGATYGYRGNYWRVIIQGTD